MMMLRVFEFAIGAILLLFIIQQVVMPLVRGTLIFPMFRDEGKLEDELQRQAQAKREAQLREAVKPTSKKKGATHV